MSVPPHAVICDWTQMKAIIRKNSLPSAAKADPPVLRVPFLLTAHLSWHPTTLFLILLPCALLLYIRECDRSGFKFIPQEDYFPPHKDYLPAPPPEFPPPQQPSQPESTHPPLVNSPFIFSKFNASEKYLQWKSGYDFEAGVSHRFHSWGCALGEAAALNRIFLFPARFTIPSRHNHGRPKTEKDIRLYIQLASLHSQVRLIEERYFWRQWRKHNLKLKSEPGLVGPTLTQRVVNWQNTTAELRDKWGDRTLIRRKFGVYTEFMYSVCYPLYFLEKGLEWVRRDDIEYEPITIPYASSLVKVGELIKQKLGSKYAAVHVRRGDKLEASHPTLDNDTQPEELIRKLPKWVPRGSTLYLATDEDAPNFFDPLKDLYVISSIGDFRHAWGEGSRWWNKSSNLFPPEDSIPFDGMMEAMVDYMVMTGAATFVETFGMLSPGNRHMTTPEEIANWNLDLAGQRDQTENKTEA